MPDTTVDTSIYRPLPHPPNALEGLLSNPSFLSQLATGNAIRGASDPQTGAIDQTALSRGLLSSPFSAGTSIPTMTAAQTLRSTTTQADAMALELNAKRTQMVADGFGTLAAKGADPKYPLSKKDFFDRAAILSRNGVPQELLAPLYRDLPDDPGALRQRAIDLGNYATGSAGLQVPRQTGYVPSGPQAGAPIIGTQGQFNYMSAPGATAPGSSAPGQPPGIVPVPGAGFEETTAAIAGKGAQIHNSLLDAYQGSQSRKALLGNMESEMQGAHGFTPGPGADWSKLGKAFINRNIPMPKDWQFDPQSFASQESFNKQSWQYAQSQFQALGGTGTDSKLDSAVHTSPNELLSQYGNMGLIRLLKGNEDAIQAQYKDLREFLNGNPAKGIRAHGANEIPDFITDFQKNFDPRVFQFKYLPAGERPQLDAKGSVTKLGSYLENMEPAERKTFLEHLRYAYKKGWTWNDEAAR